ncbi:D-sedoheptulose 7-phosphate isomerase [Halopolyspora algeriensis]|uniref:D-sedoheptulose 7-phosphate isomerase n=1 Tax=Halopolyspora algeriensis TaxID=1500506 RepID=A0A368VGZ7_9ACTN|nr:SIS domain-containing protein [Halopolyspora algeriensis]RCW40383.1 D-sedoheptulose 7-phosphate isomerase [Halopolyspora algeriensis]TQM53667.1 D-sedoheptulose 7-phosphate isomerase [Halopolyspora algeriensis]
MRSSHDDPAGDATALYPFLTTSEGDVEAVLRDVQQSTRDKAREILELRSHVRHHEGEKLVDCATAMAEGFRAGGRLLAFGNGGSSTDAQDMASLFLHPGPDERPLPAIGLTSDIAVVTALCNDVGFDVIFARQIGAFGRRHDIAVGMSTSGNSPNLLRGFDEAHRRGLLTIGIAGYEGGRMAESDSVDHLFVVPSPSVHRIQEAQTTLYHALWELTLRCLADEQQTAETVQEPARASEEIGT